jgi:hypothetical protein
MSELRELAERCEAATAGYQRRLLSEAYREIFGGPECITIDRWPGYQSPRWDAFHKKLEAEAFLDAAMTLVPEGWALTLLETTDGDRRDHTGDPLANWQAALIEHKNTGYRVDQRGCWRQGLAATAALALCAAALRAREEGNE